MNYPGRLIKVGEANAAIVTAIQQALTQRGYGPFHAGTFDAAMKSVVKLFQSQHTDREGRPLASDGIVGPMTWATLFGAGATPPASDTAPSALAQAAIDKAAAEVGVEEVPLGSNRGPRVDQYLDRVGIPPNQGTASDRYWCMAFVYFCVDEAAGSLATANPLAKTAGVLNQWNLCANRPGARRITAHDAGLDYSLVQPGQILILDHGGGHGHTGLIVAVDGPHLTVVEGNASGRPNDSNGLAVKRTTFRKLSDGEVKGFLALG